MELQPELSDAENAILLDYSQCIDELFEFFKECQDVSTEDVYHVLRNSLYPVAFSESGGISTCIVRYIVGHHDIGTIFQKIWNGMIRTLAFNAAGEGDTNTRSEDSYIGANIDERAKNDRDNDGNDHHKVDDAYREVREIEEIGQTTNDPEEEQTELSIADRIAEGDGESWDKVGRANAQNQMNENCKMLLNCIINITDWSDDFCREMGKNGSLQMLLTGLEVQKLPEVINEYSTTIVYNCCRRIHDNRILCKDAIDTLHELTESSNPDIQADAFLTLSYIVDRSESYRIALNRSCVKFLLGVLNEALDDPTRHGRGYSLLEITQGIHQVVINDNNKHMIAEFDGILLLERVLVEESSTDDEKYFAARGIWQMAFLEDIKVKIRQRKSLLETLKALKETSAKHQLRDACSGALFVIEDIDRQLRKDSDVDVDGARASSSSWSDDHHIMVSYQHDSQESILAIKKVLEKSGFRVWVDVDKTRGDILDAMADAIQKSAVVLLCVSLKFKESQHCRTEATYAYRLKKDIVPLLLEEGYTPEDWLGALVGMRKSFPMYSDEQMSANLPELIKELGTRGKCDPQPGSLDTSLASDAAATPMTQNQVVFVGDEDDSMAFRDQGTSPRTPCRSHRLLSADVGAWSNTQVHEWLTSSGIEKLNDHLKKLNGVRLRQIHRFFKRAPEFCATSLKTELELSFLDILSLVDALDKLFK